MLMSPLLNQFIAECEISNVPPRHALAAGGVHPSLWYRWAKGKGPTLRNIEAALLGLEKIRSASASLAEAPNVNLILSTGSIEKVNASAESA
jgi:hypothetical protein